MDGRDEFTEDSCSNNSQEVQEQDSISGTGWRSGSGHTLWDVPGLRAVSESKPGSVLCCLSVCIDRAVFASIEDSDSDPDHHGEDSSSNTSADDHMSTKRSHCYLRGGGVKEVRGSGGCVPKPNVMTASVDRHSRSPHQCRSSVSFIFSVALQVIVNINTIILFDITSLNHFEDARFAFRKAIQIVIGMIVFS